MLPGWAISRVIPYETFAGLITGQYKLYGGVIRWASGTPNAGQIVKHLIPGVINPLGAIPGLNFIPAITNEFGLYQIRNIVKDNNNLLREVSGQITDLSQVTQRVLQITTGTALLSGLGLTVSCIGFVALNRKLSIIDDKLKTIHKDIKAIKYFLESKERARLYAALNGLLKIDTKTAKEHCHTILHNSRNTFAEINMRYRELLSEADSVETAMTYEEYFSITSLAQVRCTAELGMFDIACKEMEEMNLFWQAQARRVADKILIGKYPERFLATDFADDVSITELAEWMDFVYEKNKSLLWIDELRLSMNKVWYSKKWFQNTYTRLNKDIGLGIKQEKQILIPAIRKLTARGSVFASYTSQYELLKTQQIKPSDFEQQLAYLPESSLVEGYLILEPVQPEAAKVVA